ncbi:hypothetical protein QBC44DRAFT_403475 [Cladorrhinum sp. PSN332]|nr:hypothetical protein QBC44DRAFT_403475 [Cladorrhinum sp. PSN332]
MQPLRRILLSQTGSSPQPRATRGFRCRLSSQQSPVPARVRPFSSSVSRCHPDPTPSKLPCAGIAHLTSRSLIKVAGPDAAKFLQGVVTSNLFTSPGPNGTVRTDPPGFYSAFLTAQGRILHDVFIYPQSPEQFLIEVDANEAEKLSKHIKRYKLRAKFDVSVLSSQEAKVWHAFAEIEDLLHDGLSVTPRPGEKKGTMVVLSDRRFSGMDQRVITVSTEEGFLDPLPVVPEKAYTVHRYMHGIPEGQSELLFGASLPHESNLDFMNAIDFRKGCYVGQELTIRTEHRGVVRKRVLPCILGDMTSEDRWGFKEGGGAERIATGASITKVAGEGEAERVKKRSNAVGKWLKGVGNMGLAVVRLEEAGVIDGDSGTGEECVVEGEGGEKVKVTPFLPGWLMAKMIKKAQKP